MLLQLRAAISPPCFSKCKSTLLIPSLNPPLRFFRDLTRCAGVAGGHIHDRVVREEVPWPQKKCDRLDGHDGEVFRGGHVRHTESVPEDDVRVGCRCATVTDPFWDTARGLTRGLGDVAACRPELVITI